MTLLGPHFAAASLVVLVAACAPQTTHSPTPPIPPMPPNDPNVVIAPVPKGTALGAAPPSSPVVVFAVHGDGMGPIVCFAEGQFFAGDTTQCTDLLKDGMPLHADTGTGTLGAAGDFSCRGAEATYAGYAFTAPNPGDAEWAISPPDAKSRVAEMGPEIAPTPAELESIKAGAVKNSEDSPPPQFDFWSGMLADLDADGRADRVFSAHEPDQLIGVVVAFLAATPTHATFLSNGYHTFPRLQRHTDIDGDGRREVWIFAAFVEGIEDQTLTSAESQALFELGNDEEASLGSWGCRAF